VLKDSQTNTQTDRGDYNTLRSLARSVMNICQKANDGNDLADFASAVFQLKM